MNAEWIAPPRMTAAIAERLVRELAAPARAYVPFLVGGHVVGWMIPERAQRLAQWRGLFRRSQRGVELIAKPDKCEARSAALGEIARVLAAEGALTAWRDERYAVAADPGAAVLCEIERAAARYFGIHTFAAHANGLVGDGEHWQMWLARRSPTKAIDPGLLDNLVGGGIAAGEDVTSTLIKEAWEEAGIAPEIARGARFAGTVEICRDQPDGLQRETINVHDLWLPADFIPANQDGEAVEHRICTPDAVLSILASDDITADASLVIVDFLLRGGHIARADAAHAALAALRLAKIPTASGLRSEQT
jgi:8-oxo-dGTP pyrophosphatase MutT (NUDIX family)